MEWFSNAFWAYIGVGVAQFVVFLVICVLALVYCIIAGIVKSWQLRDQKSDEKKTP